MKALLGARTEKTSDMGPMLRNCWGKHSSELHARLDRAFQTSGNNGKPIIGPIGKHIALGIKCWPEKN